MPSLSRPAYRWSLAALFLLAVVVRVHNVLVFPSLRAPDGFGHFTYIWFLADTGRVPLAMSGWSFFHPPLYYAWMAAVWNTMTGLAPVDRLAAGTLVVALLVLVHAFVALRFLQRRLPGRLLVHVTATAFVLFLPVQLYSAGYLGNEALGAILCSAAMLALLRLLERPSLMRAAILGLVLGLAMLTKFTALAIVAGCFATIGLRALVRRELLTGVRLLAVTGCVMLAVCGWFYLRNVELYGTPFQMSRDTLAVRRVENIQTQGNRGLLEYLLFDPVILVRPQWPRGLPLTGTIPADAVRSPLRESVWTGVFANTFFDAVGGQVLPPITLDNGARRAGQILLTLAVIPSLLMILGLAATLRDLWRKGWSDADVAMLTCFAAVIGVFVLGTKSVPMHAAVKATYLAPGWAMLGYWFGRGLGSLERRSPTAAKGAVAVSAALATASVLVFTLGLIVGRDQNSAIAKSSTWQNIYGVVAYAGGQREAGRKLFDKAAAGGWHLGYENLAALEAEDGQPLEALYHLRRAASMQPKQSFGLDPDRKDFERITQAEYQNSIAILYAELGWMDAADEAIESSLQLDPTIPESVYDRAVLFLWRSLTTKEDSRRTRLREQAGEAFRKTVELDPAFVEALEMRAVTAAIDGNCEEAGPRIVEARSARSAGLHHAYPVETGTGDHHSSALHRRRHITQVPSELTFEAALKTCGTAMTSAGQPKAQ